MIKFFVSLGQNRDKKQQLKHWHRTNPCHQHCYHPFYLLTCVPLHNVKSPSCPFSVSVLLIFSCQVNFVLSLSALLHFHCFHTIKCCYATGDILTKTTGLSQPQNKQVTVEVMQLFHKKMWLEVDGWRGK